MVEIRIRTAHRGGCSQRDNRPGWLIDFAYDEVAIEALKRTVPPRERAWCPAEDKGGAWWIAVEHEGALVQLFPAFEPYLAQLELAL